MDHSHLCNHRIELAIRLSDIPGTDDSTNVDDRCGQTTLVIEVSHPIIKNKLYDRSAHKLYLVEMQINPRVCLPSSAVGGQTAHAHIGCGVICLANISNDAVDRREKNEEIELCVVEYAIKVYAPEHLWSNNICDLVKCHISE